MLLNLNYRKDMLITFSAAFAFIVYEVFLSRFFAVILDYNFVMLAISLATLGIGFGGYLAFISDGVIYKYRNEWLGFFSLLMLVSVFVMYVLPYAGIWLYSAAAFFPFLAGGSLLAAVLQGQSERIRILYFSDLAGAGIGAVCSIWFMNVFNPMQTICLLSASLFTVSFSLSFRSATSQKKVILTVLVAALLFNGIQPFSKYISFRAYLTSPTNVFIAEKEAKIIYSDWNSFSRTDVFDAGDGELLYITIDGGAVSPISKYAGDLNQVDYLRTTTSFLAFQGIDKERALIIGAGGGQEVLTAQMAGFQQIEAVDINSGSFKAVNALSRFSGDIFQQPDVMSIVSDGRSYIRMTKNLYDLIYLSLVKKGSENNMGLALTENYIFTQEAVGEYMGKLKPGGRLAFLLHDETELAKVFIAVEKALGNEAIPQDQMKNHIAVIGSYQHLGHEIWGMGGSEITRPLLIVSKQPFPLWSAGHMKAQADSVKQAPIHVPYVYDRFLLFNKMLSELKTGLSSNRDDKPFFYNQTNRAPLPIIRLVIFVLFIAILLIRRTNYAYGHAVYFSGLAMGFMIIELTLIQRLILPLGHPTLSFVLVLGILLVAGGIGSLFSEKWSAKHTKRYVPLLWVAILSLAVNYGITWYSEQSFYLPLVYRLIAVVLLLIPLGFFMGMPFPFGLTRISEGKTAISWAINGIMTVVGSLISVIGSLTFGFTATMIIGAAIYGILYLLQPKLIIQPKNG